MPLTNIGVVGAQIAIQTVSHPAGQLVVGPVPLPAKYNFGMIVVDWTGITDLTSVISLSVDTSLDGVNFTTVGGFTLNLPTSGNSIDPIDGVGLVDPQGVPFRSTSFNLRLPQAQLTTRQIRGILNLTTPATVGAVGVFW